MLRPTLRQALEAERPLITPLAHDALSARMIELAGFKAFTVGGSALLAVRHAYPDIGLIGLSDMVAGLRDMASACPLPFFADADDGYGDVKSVARTVAAYEAIGVGGLLIEDHDRDRKQQRARPGRILEIVTTGWPSERDSRIVEQEAFGGVTARLWRTLREESMKSIGKSQAAI